MQFHRSLATFTLAVAAWLLLAPNGPAAAQEDADRPTPKDWREALVVLRAAERYDDEAVGYAGIKTDTFRAYEVLRDGADESKLVELLADERPVVRVYAARALAERDRDAVLVDRLPAHLSDVEPVETLVGCIASKQETGEAMFQVVWYEIADEARAELARALAFRSTALPIRERALRTERFRDEDHADLRRLAANGDDAALIALSRLGHTADVPLVVRSLRREAPVAEKNDALLAAALVRHDEVFAELQTLALEATRHAQERGTVRARFWVAAVAAQSPTRARDLLAGFLAADESVRSRREGRAELVYEHVAPRTDPEWNALLLALWRDHGLVDEAVLDRLRAAHPADADALVRRTLARPPGAIRYEALGPCLDALRERDVEAAGAALARLLATADAGRAEPLARRAAEWKDPRHVSGLFRLFEDDDNPYAYVVAAKALLCYDDPDIDRRLHAGPVREGWGAEWLARVLSRAARTYLDD